METIDTPQTQTGTMEQRKVERIYSYVDEKGELLYEVIRYEPKGFSQRRPDGKGGYINNMQGVRRVLYRLPQLIATPLTEPVFIVEGEKDADRLISLGFPATTNSGGAGKWLCDYNEYFKARHVGIIADNDEPGRRHAQKIAESICASAASCKIIDLAHPESSKRGFDISDWLDAGNDFRQLTNMFIDAPQYVKEKPWTRKADVVKMSEIEPEEVKWLWPGRFPLGMITLLVGDPDLGKSYFSMYVASLVSNGGTWPDGSACEQAKALILNAEDALANTVRKRLQILGADAEKIIAIRAMTEKTEAGETRDHFNIASDRSALEEVLKDNPDIRLVVIDPLSAYFGSADTFKESTVRVILAPLAEMAGRFNFSLICIMHLNKGTSSKALYRTQGSLAFPAAARAVWLVSSDPQNPESKRRFLINTKFNIGDKPSSLAFEIKDGQVVFEKEPVNVTANDIFKSQSHIESPMLDKAAKWLKDLLADGKEMPSREIFELAKKEGINHKTLQRAKKEAGIQSTPVYVDGILKSWLWKLPKDEQKTLMLPVFKSESAQGKEDIPMIKRMFQSKEIPKLSDSQKEALESNGFKVGPLEV